MFYQDEAAFGRISSPSKCWCKKGTRPSVPCHHVREYRYTYGAVEPNTGESHFIIAPYCNTDWMNEFLRSLSELYSEYKIVLICDGAAWHKSKNLKIPENMEIIHIPPYTPEMNPIEQIWREIRTVGFKNQCFKSLNAVVDRLCETIRNLSCDTVRSITHRDWMLSTI